MLYIMHLFSSIKEGPAQREDSLMRSGRLSAKPTFIQRLLPAFISFIQEVLYESHRNIYQG